MATKQWIGIAEASARTYPYSISLANLYGDKIPPIASPTMTEPTTTRLRPFHVCAIEHMPSTYTIPSSFVVHPKVILARNEAHARDIVAAEVGPEKVSNDVEILVRHF